MNNRVLIICALSVAVVALAVSVTIWSVKRSEVARFAAERAASEEEIAIRSSRKAEAERKTAEAYARAEAEKAVSVSNESVRVLVAQKVQSLATAEAQSLEAKARDEAMAAQERAQERASEAAVAKAAAEKAAAEKAAAEAAAAKARAEAELAASRLAIEKAKLDAFVAEAKLLELRKIDFETAERALIEYRQELDERERALRPEKTTADLTWVGEREADVIGATGEVRRLVRVTVRPEDDPSLPIPTRRLAACERKVAERTASFEAASSNAVVTALERLYVRARDEGRVVDADYYARSIRLLYPQWFYRQPTEEGVRP